MFRAIYLYRPVWGGGGGVVSVFVCKLSWLPYHLKPIIFSSVYSWKWTKFLLIVMISCYIINKFIVPCRKGSTCMHESLQAPCIGPATFISDHVITSRPIPWTCSDLCFNTCQTSSDSSFSHDSLNYHMPPTTNPPPLPSLPPPPPHTHRCSHNVGWVPCEVLHAWPRQSPRGGHSIPVLPSGQERSLHYKVWRLCPSANIRTFKYSI